jgi:PAS domain S-box-containing protein
MLLDESHDMIEVVDPETLRFIDFNERTCLDSGYSREELLGMRLCDLNPSFDEAAQDAAREQMQKSGSILMQTVHRHKDGSTHPVEVSIKHVKLDRSYWLGVVRDITDRQRLQQSQKLESIGQLAAGIAHEINTPTQYVGDNVRFLGDAFHELTRLLGGYVERLQTAKGSALPGEVVQDFLRAAEDSDLSYLLEEIPKAIAQTQEGVSRVSKLVGAMKEFSHPGTKEKILLNLNHAIESTITVARNEWKYVAEVETDYDPSLPPVSCLAGEFNQVILNLIVNAAHAIAESIDQGGPSRGKIRVQTRDLPEWAEIRIQDTGSGIPEKIRGRIFDPFFTTKEIGKGTGQGLSIARSVVVDKHGGTIHFESEQGMGTTFIIRLPKEARALAATTVPA